MEPERLASMPLFARVGAEERAEIASHLREVTVEEGTKLAAEGENAYELFVIEAGEVEVRKGGEKIRMLREGDFFGEIGLLTTGTRTATVIATKPTRLVVMFAREFNQLKHHMPTIAAALRETMAEHVAETSL
jgi:CRP-like cAMP-binding protein